MIVKCCRHAESVANAGHVTSDPLMIGLTEHGREQAEQLAMSWPAAPSLVIVSGARRAQDTAAPTIRRFADVPVVEWPIHEFTYLAPARCAGTDVQQRRAWVESYWRLNDPEHCDGPGAETFAAFISRVDVCLQNLPKLAGSSAPLLLFGHGQFINAMRWRLSRGGLRQNDMRDYRAFDTRLRLDNCDVAELVLP